MYFSAGAEGRISYGHLGRTNLFYLLLNSSVGNDAKRNVFPVVVARRLCRVVVLKSWFSLPDVQSDADSKDRAYA